VARRLLHSVEQREQPLHQCGTTAITQCTTEGAAIAPMWHDGHYTV